jgi:hypothetical protein
VRSAHRRFANTQQNVFRGWYISERLADMPPSLAAINIHEQSCVQGDVLSLHTGTTVQKTVGSNHPRTWVAQDGELTVHNVVPDTEGVLAIVNADGYKTGIERLELFRMLRELAQLARAVRSPVSSIKN